LPPLFFRRHESAAEATASKVREEGMAHLTMVLFRDGRRDGGDAVAAILRDIVRGRAGRYSVKEIDVQDRPALAAHYNVRTTPTVLLMNDGDVVDRVVGTPTRILLDSLLGARTEHASPAVA
jgi:thioredoxin-like negative regulator of GroEL